MTAAFADWKSEASRWESFRLNAPQLAISKTQLLFNFELHGKGICGSFSFVYPTRSQASIKRVIEISIDYCRSLICM